MYVHRESRQPNNPWKLGSTISEFPQIWGDFVKKKPDFLYFSIELIGNPTGKIFESVLYMSLGFHE